MNNSDAAPPPAPDDTGLARSHAAPPPVLRLPPMARPEQAPLSRAALTCVAAYVLGSVGGWTLIAVLAAWGLR